MHDEGTVHMTHECTGVPRVLSRPWPQLKLHGTCQSLISGNGIPIFAITSINR